MVATPNAIRLMSTTGDIKMVFRPRPTFPERPARGAPVVRMARLSHRLGMVEAVVWVPGQRLQYCTNAPFQTRQRRSVNLNALFVEMLLRRDCAAISAALPIGFWRFSSAERCSQETECTILTFLKIGLLKTSYFCNLFYNMKRLK